MYSVYLRKISGAIVGNVCRTSNREDAERAFAALVNEAGYDGFELVAVLIEDKRPIAIHRFNQPPGVPQNWRDRLGELPFSTLH